MKKLLALFLTVAMLCTFLVVPVSAEGTPSVEMKVTPATFEADGAAKTATLEIVLHNPDPAASKVAGASFTLVSENGKAVIADTAELTTEFSMKSFNAKLKKATFANMDLSSMETYATDKTTITLLKVLITIGEDAAVGDYVIKANDMCVTNTDGENIFKNNQSCTIKLTAPIVKVTGVTLNKNTMSLVATAEETLTATVAPENATNKAVTWSTSNDKVATVADGKVTAVAPGEAVITATTADGGFTATCKVTVTEKPCDHPDAKLTKVDAKEATCTEPGNAECWLCGECGKYLSLDKTTVSDTIIGDKAALGHDMTAYATVPATCVKTGTKAYFHCGRCEKNFADPNGLKELDDLTLAIDPNNHVGDTELVNVKAASHVNKENGYTGDTKCLSCGEIITKGEIIPWGTHTWGEWQTDGEKHWKECIVEGCTERDQEGVHNGGTATCQEKAKCEVCGAAYGKLGEHNFDTKWTSDGTHHYHKCLTAGCTEKKEGAEHSSTGDNIANCLHKAKCDVCKAEYGDLGAHTLTKTAAKAPTCLETGNNEYYTCSVCGKVFKNAAGTTETTVAAETLAKTTTHNVETGKYATSATEHWQICKVCGTVVGKAAHKFGEADANGRKTCADCGYTVGGTGTEGHKHAAGNTICYDENNHWNKCTDDNCDAHVNESAHKFGPKNTVTEGNKTITIETCSECGYVKRTETTTGGTTPVNPGGNKPTKPGTKDNGKTVQSGKTFDAGVGVYVGLSILSLTGSAVVIGKKRKTR